MIEIFVEEEAGFLKTAAVFTPGLEAYLAQFLHQKKSLFESKFDVEKAQKEHRNMVDILRREGVKVIDFRRVYASMLPEQKIEAERLLRKLSQKFPDSDPRVIERLFERDVSSYGEGKAVSLNRELSASYPYPLGNIHFARDQSNVLFDTCILANMANGIRQPEVDIIQMILYHLGVLNMYKPKSGIFEGGDAMSINGRVCIGSGKRTTRGAVEEIATRLSVPTYMVAIPDNGNWHKDMATMHLDTFFMPLADYLVIGCKEVLSECKLYDMQTGREIGNFLKYLQDNYEVLDIPKREQKNYASSMLVVAPKKVIVPSNANKATLEVLRSNGVTTINAVLKEITKDFGAVPCMVLQLEKYRR